MAPKPPNVRRAPAEPWRSSVLRGGWSPDMAPKPSKGRGAARQGRGVRRSSARLAREHSVSARECRRGARGPLVGLIFNESLRERARAHLSRFERRTHAPAGRRPASVAVVLLPDDQGRACFLLTRRADRLRAHARQWALPGGRIDPGESAEDAALRELREEVGLTLDADAVLG